MSNTMGDFLCYGCEKKCRYDNSFRCNLNTLNFFIWPDSDQMLCYGIVSLIRGCTFNKRVLFIDCSLRNISQWLLDDWLWDMKNEGVIIIIISDKFLSSLADYWLEKMISLDIPGGVIYSNDDLKVIKNKIHYIIAGNCIFSSQIEKRMTATEYYVLQFLYRGVTPKKISTLLKVGVKTIYSCKGRIERKLGIRLKKIHAIERM